MKHNEDTRVKIPSILHLARLGYKYLSLKNSKWDINTNIFIDIFKSSIERIKTKTKRLASSNAYERTSKSKMKNNNILIYENQNGNIKVDVKFEDDSIWLSQKEIQLSGISG